MENKNFEDLMSLVVKFRDERNWKQFHNAKDLAISLSLEASELLENFQWKTSEEVIENNLESIKEELADIYIYALLLSNELGIDIEKIIKEKVEKNKEKYPVNKAYGTNQKYTELK
ncbi:nucleotide pyrophosphohydrolase [Bacillus wiedmannii]|uniref:nucleotide pyrophosphohydrolase n=1 Tax=Bacillus wiedmannii TaxID=1890302 RepID=UPI000BF096C3|nr:nucleotide pyrophosphohydrolase [Bacillus wiedmannii]PEO97601.1 nucleotide pyrophosphohydrolase [Bacillus wiedmannii]